MIRQITNKILFFPFQKKFYSFALIFFMFIPVFYLMLWSLSSSESYFSVGDFSIKWYKAVIYDNSWQSSIIYSLAIAFSSSFFALTLALIYYYYSLILYAKYRIYGLILTVLPVIFPILVYAVSLKLFGNLISFQDWIVVLIGHIIIIFPLQFFILESSKEKVNVNWIFSAFSFGANNSEIVFKIIIPNIKKTLAIAYGFGFLMSFDEIVISNFIIDTHLSTVPKKIWNDIDRVLNPKPIIPYLLVLFGVAVILFSLNLVINNKHKIVMASKKSYKTLKRKVLHPFLYSLSMFMLSLIFTIILKKFFNVNIDTFNSIVISFFGSFITYIIISYYSIFKWASEIIDIIADFRKRRKKNFRRISTDLLTVWIDKTFEKVNNILEGKEGESLNIREVNNLTEALFKNNKGYYFGTDSNVPSRFKLLYPLYLLQNKESKSSVRILLCDKRALKDDYQTNQDDFIKFYNWHILNGMELFQVNAEKIRDIVKNFNLKSTDIGIWDNDYIVAFIPSGSKTVTKIKFWFLSSDTPHSNDYIRYYLHLLESCNAKRIKVNNMGLTFENIEYNTIYKLKNRLLRLWNLNV